MLSTNYRNRIVDICCRMVSTDGEVTLEEIIWMYKFWQDTLEERLAGVNAARQKLEEQMARDTVNTTSTGTSSVDES